MRFLAVLILLSLVVGCAPPKQRKILTSSYCACRSCCSWSRGFPDFWNRYYVAGADKGSRYTGLTASGTKPREPYDGLLSVDTLTHPWKLPHRIVFPWLWLSNDGTIAADTKFYPFGTRMYVPGYGWGRVEDRGSAIKGIDRIDLFKASHQEALEWGKKKVLVTIEKP